MRWEEKYGPVSLSIIDEGGNDSPAWRAFQSMFGSLLDLLESEEVVNAPLGRSMSGPGLYELAVKVDGSIVRPEQVGLNEFAHLWEDRPGTSIVAGWVPQEDLDRIRAKLKELFE